MQNRRTVIGVFLLVLCVFVGIAVASTFIFKDVVALPTAQETDTYGINNARAIVGDYVDSSGVQHGMILGGVNVFTSANRPDCQTTPASTSIAFYGINSLNVAAGWCTNQQGVQIAFTYYKGQFSDIHIPGALLVQANGINDSGTVVGTYVDSSGVQHGYRLQGTTLTNLDPPGTTGNVAWGINNAGTITVYGTNSSGGFSSFVTTNGGGSYTPFNPPDQGPTGTAIHQINNRGDIVATVFDASGNRHGVLFHNNTFTDFDDPNGVGSTRGNGLNDNLIMVGRYGSGLFGGTGYEVFTTP